MHPSYKYLAMKNKTIISQWALPVDHDNCAVTKAVTAARDNIEKNGLSFFGAEEYQIGHHNEEQILKSIPLHPDNYFMLGCAENYHPEIERLGRIVLWPTVFLFHTDLLLNNVPAKQNIDKLYINLNGRGKAHRCAMMDCLAKHKMLVHGNNTWHRHDEKIYDWEYWKPTKLVLDEYVDNENQYSPPLQWTSSLYNLVSESSDEIIFFTEKTWMPILTEKPFIINGAKHSHKKLQEWGFKLYDEIIDYDFDNYEGKERISKIVLFLKSQKEKDFNALYDCIKDKLIYNKQRAKKLLQERFLVPNEAYEYENYVNLINGEIK